MAAPINRRSALKKLGAVGVALTVPRGIIRGGAADIVVAGQPVEIAVTSLSAVTVRITIRPLQGGAPTPVPYTGALEHEDPGRVAQRGRVAAAISRVRAGDLIVKFTDGPPTLQVETAAGVVVQRLALDASAPGMSFLLGDGPVLGFGEGGQQFDRRGTVDRMTNGQVGYQLATHGGRAPVQWLISTGSSAIFIHQPYGSFDLSGTTGKFMTAAASALPLDVFIVSSKDPTVIMRDYGRISGLPELPALWTFGYLQSHRTLAGPDEVLAIARTFREKKLPCDALIYLGTDFCPAGWNTHNGEFTWNPATFPEPKKMIDALHAEHFKVVLHTVIEGNHLTGTVHDPCTAPPIPSGRTPDGKWPPDRQVPCYWPVHKEAMDQGADGWWPDQGDDYDGPSRFNRHRMYWEGTQLFRPNERPFALHRNASAGVQRYGGFLWSGDVDSRWETLKTHVPVAINTSLSGLPYWGTDIGGFIPTAELTGELYARWFQFGAFCPLFRSHGRNWHLRLPWGWDGGDGGPLEAGRFRADPAELHNAQVEPICRKYLELRYRLMPYLYTAVRECHDTGMPIIRAMWLHYPEDPIAVARGDQYLWGRDMLVAPVVEKGATSRRLYLPHGRWYDFWTNTPIEGDRDIDRDVDLATTPIYVRAGAVIPMGPVMQYTGESDNRVSSMVIYPGADGHTTYYEDDGRSFNYRRGESMRLEMRWQDVDRKFTLRLAPSTRMLGPPTRMIDVHIAGSTKHQMISFTGSPVEMSL
jgi:alpha-glucosidase (family GH31 glycosyl hydrolase)